MQKIGGYRIIADALMSKQHFTPAAGWDGAKCDNFTF